MYEYCINSRAQSMTKFIFTLVSRLARPHTASSTHETRSEIVFILSRLILNHLNSQQSSLASLCLSHCAHMAFIILVESSSCFFITPRWCARIVLQIQRHVPGWIAKVSLGGKKIFSEISHKKHLRDEQRPSTEQDWTFPFPFPSLKKTLFASSL